VYGSLTLTTTAYLPQVHAAEAAGWSGLELCQPGQDHRHQFHRSASDCLPLRSVPWPTSLASTAAFLGRGRVELLRGFRLDPDDQRDPGRGRTVAELLDTVGGRRLQRNSEPQPRNRIFERHISGDLGITPVTAAA
jgi:hypothetical protein